MQVVIDGLLTTYDDKGKGKIILLLHGWGDSRQTFRQLISELAKNYRVISVDLPGFGTTEPPHDVWGLDEYADFIAHLINKLDLKLYGVVAHSNGGSVAIRGIARGYFSTERLVLLASAGIRNRHKIRKLALKVIAKIGKLLTFWAPRHMKRQLQKKLYGVAGSDMNVVPHLRETFKKTVRQDVQADARNIHVPTLLVYGSEDKATPPLYGKIYTSLIKEATLHVVDGAGHFVHHDRPKVVVQYVKDFFHG